MFVDLPSFGIEREEDAFSRYTLAVKVNICFSGFYIIMPVVTPKTESFASRSSCFTSKETLSSYDPDSTLFQVVSM